MSTQRKKKSRKPSQGSLKASNSIKNTIGCEIYTSCRCKTIPKGDAAAIEANHVLGLPLTVFTRRVKSITSKATVLDEAPVLAKSISEEGS